MRRLAMTVCTCVLLIAMTGLLAPSFAAASTRFLGGATATTVLSVLKPWTQDYGCACCVCWEAALTTVYAYWDDHLLGSKGPWGRLLPGGNGRDATAFKKTSQRLYELAGIACEEGSNVGGIFYVSKATEVGRAYNDELGYDFEHDFDNFVWFGQDIQDEIDANKPVYYSFTGPFQTYAEVSHAVVIVGYESDTEKLYIYDNWDPWTTSRGLDDSTDSRTVNITPDGCDCSEGDCCNGCGFMLGNTICKLNDQLEKGCPFGNGCGSKVGLHKRSRVCTGESSSCGANYGPWSTWTISHTCGATAACTLGSVPGNAFCIEQTSCSTEPCTDECDEADVYQCASNTDWQICGDFDEDPCLDWSDPEPCGDGEVCEDAYCFVPCVSECTEGERRCVSSRSFQRCEISTEDSCPRYGTTRNCPNGSKCDAASNACVAVPPDDPLPEPVPDVSSETVPDVISEEQNPDNGTLEDVSVVNDIVATPEEPSPKSSGGGGCAQGRLVSGQWFWLLSLVMVPAYCLCRRNQKPRRS